MDSPPGALTKQETADEEASDPHELHFVEVKDQPLDDALAVKQETADEEVLDPHELHFVGVKDERLDDALAVKPETADEEASDPHKLHFVAVENQRLDNKLAVKQEIMDNTGLDIKDDLASTQVLFTINPNRQFKCVRCRCVCTDLLNFQQHMLFHLEETRFDTCRDGNLCRKGRPSICEGCGFETTETSSLYDHMKAHTSKELYECNICKIQTERRPQMEQHMTQHVKDSSVCVYCGFTYVAEGSLRKHMLMHSRKKIYRCNLCKFRSNYEITLKMHMVCHTAVKPCKCSKCELTTMKRTSFLYRKLKHEKRKLYKCKNCDYRTPVKKFIRVHLEICTDIDSVKSDLSSSKTHLKTRGENPALETQCLKMAISKKPEQANENTSTNRAETLPFKCNQCDYSTAKEQYLQMHTVTHEGPKPYVCGKCGHKCALRRSLHMHMMNHVKK